MRVSALATCVAVLLLAGPACNPAARHATLTFLFDGVPPPKPPEPPPDQMAGGAKPAAGPRKVGYTEHGPYAAKNCNACHQSTSNNSFVAPREQLCFRCHEFKLDKKYLHGPLASGGCMACHDPHSSQYRYLLVAESDTFCFRCHDRAAVERNPVHPGGETQCTECHDPHTSDNEYLLR